MRRGNVKDVRGRPIRRTAGFAALVVAAAGAPCGGAALAQPQLIGVTPERGQTVVDRARPEVDPAGVRLDGFRLDASAVLGIGYDSNILGTNTNRVQDGYVDTGARASIVSDWTVHRLGAQAGVLNRSYFNNGNFDWTDWDASVFGRYDLDTVTSLSADYIHSRQHLSPQNVDVQQSGLNRPVPYNVDQVDVGGSTRLNRTTFGLGASYATYRYDDVAGPGTSGQVSLYDYDLLTARLDVGYEFVQGRAVTAAVVFQDVNYRDAATSSRDSQTWAGLVGFRYDFDGVWAARIAVGYARREYSGAQFKPLETPAVDATVTWNVTSLTTLNFFARRTIQESIRQTTASYVSNYGEIRADHELYRNIILTGAVGLDGQEYQQPSQLALDLNLRASVTWLINRNLALSLDYRFVDRVAHTGGLQPFDENIVLLRLRAAL